QHRVARAAATYHHFVRSTRQKASILLGDRMRRKCGQRRNDIGRPEAIAQSSVDKGVGELGAKQLTARALGRLPREIGIGQELAQQRIVRAPSSGHGAGGVERVCPSETSCQTVWPCDAIRSAFTPGRRSASAAASANASPNKTLTSQSSSMRLRAGSNRLWIRCCNDSSRGDST